MNQIGCATITYRLLNRATALQWIAADGLKTIDLGVITNLPTPIPLMRQPMIANV